MRKGFLFLGVLVLGLSACSTKTETPVSIDFEHDVLLPYTSVRNQGRTQTCWAYTMASMLESDLLTVRPDTVRLSVMYAVRQKYMRQFEAYYYSKGREEIRGGSLGHTFLNGLKVEGVVPQEVYKGVQETGKHPDHRSLLKELRESAEKAVKQKNLPVYKQKAEELLDTYMGKVPERFIYQGQEYTPLSFADSLDLEPDRYMELTSFSHHPFYSWNVLEVPDNWEHALYYNVPIDSMETYVNRTLRNGRTVAWDGDISEEGFMPRSGVALYPDSLVTQETRQQEFEQFETTDDHMMHIIGMAHDESGNSYYILKNSWGKIGPYKGLLYMSREYFRAKTVSVVVPVLNI